jgi:hypothetical protein
VVLKIVNPVAGEAIAFLSAVVIRGGKKPFVVDSICKAEDASGLVVPIPTWAVSVKLAIIHTILTINFFIFFGFKWDSPFHLPKKGDHLLG